MKPAVIQIETVVSHSKTLWRVRLGRRALTFHEELAARTFASQLRMRKLWLQKQASQPPTPD